MAFLRAESFDGFQTDLLQERFTFVSAGVSIDTVHGQCGSQSLKTIQTPSQGYVTVGLASGDTRVVGSTSVYTESTSISLCSYSYGVIPIFYMMVGIDGSITAYYNPDAAFPPVSFVTDGGLVNLSRLTYVSWEILLGASGTGTARIAIDGQERWSATGLNTAWPGEDVPPTGFNLGGLVQGTKTVWFDSLILCDGTGSRNNSLLGHKQVQWLFADGAGATTDFSVTGAGANWNVSDNNDPDPSTIYISSNTVGATDTYTFTDVPLITGTVIDAVQGNLLAKEDAAGSRTVDFVVRQGGTDFLSGNPLGVPTTDFGYLLFPMEDNPATSAQWTMSDVNADQDGGKIVS